MSGKRYPEEFKVGALRQVKDRGYSVPEVAELWDRAGDTPATPQGVLAFRQRFSTLVAQLA